MKQIKTEVAIAAKPEQVWAVLADLSSWTDWNPIVTKVEGKLAKDQEIMITMSDGKGGDGKKYSAIITELGQNKKFVFVSKMMASFLFSIDRVVELEEKEDQTILKQSEIYNGLLVSLFSSKLDGFVPNALNSMNEALKKKVETQT